MKRRDVEAALRASGCEPAESSGRGDHEKWFCSCGARHSANIPRHRESSPGVVESTIERLACLPKGWLQ